MKLFNYDANNIEYAISKEYSTLQTTSSNIINPDNYSGTDTEKVQAAVSAACANSASARPTVIEFNRMFTITSTISFNAVRQTLVPIYFLGQGGGIYKTVAGSIFESGVGSWADVYFTNMTFMSSPGANVYIANGVNLIGVTFSNCSFKMLDSIWRAKFRNPGAGYLQNIRLQNCYIDGGIGNLFECEGFYGLYLDGCSVQYRYGDTIHQLSPSTGNVYISCYQVNITNCLMESLWTLSSSGINSARPATILNTQSFNIIGNYFEANDSALGATIPSNGTNIYVSGNDSIYGLNINGNRNFNDPGTYGNSLVKLVGTINNIYSTGNLIENGNMYDLSSLEPDCFNTSINDIAIGLTEGTSGEEARVFSDSSKTTNFFIINSQDKSVQIPS